MRIALLNTLPKDRKRGDVLHLRGRLSFAHLPGSVEEIGRRCFQESGLAKIAIPKRLNTIEEDTFLSCTALEEVTFQKHSRICMVEKGAFLKTSLRRHDVDFPLGTKVSVQAFAGE